MLEEKSAKNIITANSKRIGLFILIFLLLLNSAIGLFIYFGYYTVYEKSEFEHSNAYSLYPDSIIAIAGYEQKGNTLLAQQEDAQIQFELPPYTTVASMIIELSEAVTYSHFVQIFYLNNDIGQYNAENSVTVDLSPGDTEIILDLPPEVYTNLRCDIDISNEEFEIKNVLVSESPLTKVWFRNYVRDSKVIFFVLLTNIVLVFIWLLARKKGYIANAGLYIKNILANTKSYHKKEFLENKSASILTNLANVFLFLIFLVLLISLCFFNNGSYVDMKGQLIMALIFFGILFMLYKVLCALRKLFMNAKVSFGSSLCLMFVCLFAMQLYMVLNISTSTGWDVGIIVREAASEAPVDSQYLSVYPNNLLLFFIIRKLITIIRLVGITDVWLGLSIVNILLVDLSLFFSIITIKKINSSFEANPILLILFSLLIGFSPWLIVPYSDTISIPIVSALVLYCILAVQAKTKTKRFIYAVSCGLLFAIGWLLKSTIIAVGGAFLITLVLYALRERKKVKIRRSIVFIAVGILSCALTMGLFDLYVENQNTVIIDKTIRTPMSYSIATGLVERPAEKTRMYYGAWNEEAAALNTGKTQEKNDAYCTFIQERLQEFGVSGYSRFLINKARWITSEGNFFYPGEGVWDFSDPDANLLRTFLYNNGENFQLWRHAVNGLWIVVFMGCFLDMIFPWFKRIKGKEGYFDNDLFLRLSALFIILVILIIEGRSRYLISFLPIFCIISANGYSCFIKTIKVIGVRKNKINE